MSTTVRGLDDDAERAERLAEARAAREAERAKAAAAQAFTPVPEVPKMARMGRPLNVPASRQALIDYARTHPGQWLRYEPTPEQDKAKPHRLANMINKQQGGFTAGFQCKTRNKFAYIRYTPQAVQP